VVGPYKKIKSIVSGCACRIDVGNQMDQLTLSGPLLQVVLLVVHVVVVLLVDHAAGLYDECQNNMSKK